MKKINNLLLLTFLLWVIVRFFLRSIVAKNQYFDFWFTESYPSFGVVFGYTLFSYTFLNRRDKLFFHCSAYTFGGLFYEIIGQKHLNFGTFSFPDVLYTIIGGISAYLVLKNFELKTKLIDLK